MKPKFKVRDKVIVNYRSKRLPRYIKDEIRRNRKRTVVGVYFDPSTQHIRYYLGSNRMGADITSYPFRAEELSAPVLGRKAGRPRTR